MVIWHVPDQLQVGKVSSLSIYSIEVDDYLELVLEPADYLRDVDSGLDASGEKIIVKDHEVLVLIGQSFAGQSQTKALEKHQQPLAR